MGREGGWAIAVSEEWRLWRGAADGGRRFRSGRGSLGANVLAAANPLIRAAAAAAAAEAESERWREGGRDGGMIDEECKSNEVHKLRVCVCV